MKFVNIEFIPLMLVPSFILLYLVLTNKSMIERIFDDKILRKLRIDQGLSKQLRVTLLFLALFTMIIAMARPVYQKGVVELESYSGDVVLALDLSLSMKTNDFFPNRLEFAKKKIEEFIKEAKGYRIGLIGFARDAFIVSPLTSDKDALLYLLHRLDTKSLTLKGTNIQAALMSANLLFGKNPSKYVVLFTDGGDKKDFSKTIEYAKKHHIKVSVIGVARDKGAPIEVDGKFLTDKKGNIVITKLNHNISKLTSATGGIFEPARLDTSDIQTLLDYLAKGKISKKIEKVIQTTELYPYLLIFSILFLFMSFFTLPDRKAVLLLLLACNLQLHAGLRDFKLIKEAKEAYSRGAFKQASRHFELIAKEKGSPQSYYDAGNAFYKAGEYKKAIEYYSKVQTNDKELEFRKLHNLGNSYFKLKQYKKAIEMYEKALKLKKDPDTKYNLELAKKMLKKSSKKRNQQKKQQKSKQQKRKPQQKNQSNKNKSDQKSRQNKSQKGSKKQQAHTDKNEPISSREEKKWLKLIQQNRSKTLLYKAPIKIKGTDENPW